MTWLLVAQLIVWNGPKLTPQEAAAVLAQCAGCQSNVTNPLPAPAAAGYCCSSVVPIPPEWTSFDYLSMASNRRVWAPTTCVPSCTAWRHTLRAATFAPTIETIRTTNLRRSEVVGVFLPGSRGHFSPYRGRVSPSSGRYHSEVRR